MKRFVVCGQNVHILNFDGTKNKDKINEIYKINIHVDYSFVTLNKKYIMTYNKHICFIDSIKGKIKFKVDQ